MFVTRTDDVYCHNSMNEQIRGELESQLARAFSPTAKASFIIRLVPQDA